MTAPALEVRDLAISVGDRRHARVVDGVSFSVAGGHSLGIVGESGSGKSLTLRGVMALTPRAVRIEAGTVALGGVDLPMRGRPARASRRGRMAMICQDPLSALDPVHTAGSQISEVARTVGGRSRPAAWDRAVELLDMVGIRQPARRARDYPHQLSGGMRQRVMIAMALASEASVLLCDEPTTALDVTVQAQVLDLLDSLRARLGLTLVFVSHDLAVVRAICEHVAVMYAGRFVETGPAEALLERPRHPYTYGLRQAVVDVDDAGRTPRSIPGELPEPGRLPSGCPFHPRCPYARYDCRGTDVRLEPVAGEPGRMVACLHSEEVPVP